MKCDPPRAAKPVHKKGGTKWAVNRAIARKLRKLDCDPVTLLARIAKDEEAPVALRYRATARLAQLLHAPKAEAATPPAPEPEPEPDIAAIIAAAWRDDAEKKRRAAARPDGNDRVADAEDAGAEGGPAEAGDQPSQDEWE